MHIKLALVLAHIFLLHLGIKVDLIDGTVTVKARLLVVVTDLPPKAAIMKVTQFNGEFGCPVCLHKGEQVSSVYSS